MYGKLDYLSVNCLQHDLVFQEFQAKLGLISGMGDTDMFYIPPCKTSLRNQILGVNYQCVGWINPPTANYGPVIICCTILSIMQMINNFIYFCVSLLYIVFLLLCFIVLVFYSSVYLILHI